MIIGLIGSRGTIPTAETATVSFLVDNRYLFECPSEIIQTFSKFQKSWMKISNIENNNQFLAIGRPTLGKIKYIILSHLHYDHWGGLPHIIHRIMLLEREMRKECPLKVIIPEFSTLVFQKRMKEIYGNLNNQTLSDDEFLYNLLTIEVGTSIRDVLNIIVIKDGESISLDNEYSLLAKKNNHLVSGSFSYRLEFKRTKLDVKKAKKIGIPFNRTLKKIEKSQSPIDIGSSRISRSDIFYDLKISLGYSGDTEINRELFKFFNGCQILIHDTTYFSPEENFHLDLHSDFLSLLQEADELKELKALIPIHFSTRYKDDEISDHLKSILDKPYLIINPITTIFVQITPDNEIIVSKWSE
jgi:ribonuclease BN (tRNA processing enzyme)